MLEAIVAVAGLSLLISITTLTTAVIRQYVYVERLLEHLRAEAAARDGAAVEDGSERLSE